jgi:hypothetical protein
MSNSLSSPFVPLHPSLLFPRSFILIVDYQPYDGQRLRSVQQWSAYKQHKLIPPCCDKTASRRVALILD